MKEVKPVSDLNTIEKNDYKFIQFLISLVQNEDLGALAALRRGLGKVPGSAIEMHRFIVPFLDPNRPWDDPIYFLVGTLFAMHQTNWERKSEEITNFGASVVQLINSENQDAVDRRFTVLLNSDFEDLPQHLRQMIAMLKTGSRTIPVDWLQLIRDLRFWNNENKFVQLKWAKAFWANRNVPEPLNE